MGIKVKRAKSAIKSIKDLLQIMRKSYKIV